MNLSKSWEQMGFTNFNLIGSDSWAPGAVMNNWAECDLLDELHNASGDLYSWGYTKANPNGSNGTPTTSSVSSTATTSTTTTSTATSTTTTTTSTTSSNEADLPDYNDVQYSFSCDSDNTCTLTMSDGQTFRGIKVS